MHVCPATNPGPSPHVGGPIVSGVPTVLVANVPVATLGSTAVCCGPTDTVVQGSPTVLVGGKPAVRMGDSCAHGGKVVAGSPMLLIP